MRYGLFLERMHRWLEPELYLEIGVRNGHSLAGSRCRSYAIDPAFSITQELNCHVRLFRSTSDEFFARPNLGRLFERRKIDLAFIDGLHLFENVVTDFFNVERYCSPHAVVAIDDVFPRTAAEARRDRQTKEWTGDVWRVLDFLARHRPDLLLVPVDTTPTGLVLVFDLSPGRPLPGEMRRAIAAEAADVQHVPGEAIIRRQGALPPATLLDSGLLDEPRIGPDALRAKFRELFPEALLPGFLGPVRRTPLPVASAAPGGDHRFVVHPGRRFPPRADLVAELRSAMAQVELRNPGLLRSTPDTWLDGDTVCPPLGVELLDDAYVFGGRMRQHAAGLHRDGQLVLTKDEGLTLASFGILDGVMSLADDLLAPEPEPGAGHRFIGYRRLEHLAGAQFLIGSAHRHFGHMLLEGLSRLWALEEVGRREKDLKFLVFEPELEPWAATLLERAGVPRDALVHAPPAARVERLYAPDAAVGTHSWLSPVLRPVWERIAARPPDARRPAGRYYLSRAAVENRPLENEEEIAALFAAHGYEIVAPERLAIEEQLALAADASHLAGCVGSQLYLAQFQRPGASNVVVAPRNFYLRDDVLIAQAMGHRIALAFGSEIDFAQPKKLRSWRCDPAAVAAAIARAA